MLVCDAARSNCCAGFVLSFNPCFSGCWSATSPDIVFNAIIDEVSILVLVDVGLRPYLTFRTAYSFTVSILVLVDVGLRQYPADWVITAYEVSILVLVDVGLRQY